MLHESIKAAVEQRLAVAQAAAALQADPENGWGIEDRVITPHIGVVHEVEARQHIALNNPARIIRDCQRDLKVLARHRPRTHLGGPIRCADEGEPWPCDEILDLAEAYDIPTGDSP